MSHRSALAQLKAARAGKESRFDAYHVEEHAPIYDTVDESGYKAHVRDRMQADDFVDDDDGRGYADNGREESPEPQQYSSDEDDARPKGKAAKRKREEAQEKNRRENHQINQYWAKRNAPAANQSTKPKVTPQRVPLALC